jgi:anti-sigma B factor antagonist
MATSTMSDDTTGTGPGARRVRSDQARGRRAPAPPREVMVVEVQGNLDLSTAPKLCARLAPSRMRRGSNVVLDLSGVAFCDSSGLRPILRAAHEIVVHGGRIAVVVPPGSQPARLFLLTGIEEFLAIATDREAALELLGSRWET